MTPSQYLQEVATYHENSRRVSIEWYRESNMYNLFEYFGT